MKLPTRVFLVLLRFAIGWHFLFEGLEKVQAPTWTSEPYLREASGPLAPSFRRQAGDPLVDRYTLIPLEPNQDVATVPPHQRFPKALARDWDAYCERFAKFYELDADQRGLAEEKLKKSKEKYALDVNKTTKFKRESPYGPPVDVDRTRVQLLQEYENKVKETRESQDRQWSIFGTSTTAQLSVDKAEANRLRAELRKELDQHTEEMKQELQKLLTPDQIKKAWRALLTAEQLQAAEDVKKILDDPQASQEHLAKIPRGVLTPQQQAQDPIGTISPGWSSSGSLEWIDWITKWGLCAVGVGLLLGLFTRTACVGGAGFLLLFYLAMPALPGLPENPKAEGHYLFVNKNIIEMLALLALATTRSGRWAGLDGLLSLIRPRLWKKKVKEGGTAEAVTAPAGVPGQTN